MPVGVPGDWAAAGSFENPGRQGFDVGAFLFYECWKEGDGKYVRVSTLGTMGFFCLVFKNYNNKIQI